MKCPTHRVNVRQAQVSTGLELAPLRSDTAFDFLCFAPLASFHTPAGGPPPPSVACYSVLSFGSMIAASPFPPCLPPPPASFCLVSCVILLVVVCQHVPPPPHVGITYAPTRWKSPSGVTVHVPLQITFRQQMPRCMVYAQGTTSPFRPSGGHTDRFTPAVTPEKAMASPYQPATAGMYHMEPPTLYICSLERTTSEY